MRLPLRPLAAPLLAAALLLAGCPAKEASCPSGQTRCFGSCVDAQTDPNGCGPGCDLCPTGGSCVAGVCVCPAGLTRCGQSCVDTKTDAANCGGCGQRCGLGTCADSGGVGACTCDGGATECPGVWPRCVDTATDPSNCGACGTHCGTGEECSGSACACLPGYTDCSTACFDLQSDPAHCGGCTTACPTGAACDAATCSCPAAKPDVCGTSPGACVSKATDESNCGTCGHVCASGATCTSGSCACPQSPSVVCGSTSPGSCCEGTGCCSGACQTVHANGLGQSFYDCNPLYTLTLAAAQEAADAWGTGSTYDMTINGCASCIGRQTGSACAVWCYVDSPLAGRVHLNAISVACVCPSSADPTWN